VLAWLGYWLKGEGDIGDLRVGKVDFQDGDGRWHEGDAWPPHQARQEVLYLSANRLSSKPGAGSRSFRSLPQTLNQNNFRLMTTLCSDSISSTGLAGLAWMSPPLRRDVIIAGNPFAYLRLSADQPGGIVAVNLVDIGPDFSCESLDAGFITWGGADLRFFRGNFTGFDFPVGRPTGVRVDLRDRAQRIQRRHRIALIVSDGEYATGYSSGQPWFPEVTVHADGGPRASQLVLPVIAGTFGGRPPRIAYPPRPFVPPGRVRR
jgi:predicted acyl esterase